MQNEKYPIPASNATTEKAREDYERAREFANLMMRENAHLPNSEVDDDDDYWDCEDDSYEESKKQERAAKRKQKKKLQRALDMLETQDWTLNGAPKTPQEAKKRRKELKRRIKGKPKKLDWRSLSGL